MANAASRLRSFLREAEGQPVEPLEEKPLGAVQAFDVAGAYRPLLALAYPAYAVALGPDHFGRGVDHRGVAVLLDDRAVLGVGAESQVNRLGVGGKAIGRDLDDRSVAARLVGVRIAESWALGNTSRPATSIMNRRALSADRLPMRKLGMQLGFLVNARPEVNVPDVAAVSAVRSSSAGIASSQRRSIAHRIASESASSPCIRSSRNSRQASPNRTIRRQIVSR